MRLISSSGFTLVGFLVTGTLGLLCLGSAASLCATIIVTGRQYEQTQQLENELDRLVIIMKKELTNRGFQHLGYANLVNGESVSQVFANQFSLAAFAGEPPYSCVLFAYDRNKNGALDTESPEERTGFRLRSNAVELRVAGADCRQNGWQDISDPDIVTVESLLFSIKQRGRAKQLSTKITASLKSWPRIQSERQFAVTVPHD